MRWRKACYARRFFDYLSGMRECGATFVGWNTNFDLYHLYRLNEEYRDAVVWSRPRWDHRLSSIRSRPYRR